MRKTLIAALLATLGACPLIAAADDAKPDDAKPDAPKPDWTFAGNFALSSEYLYRGIAQSDHKPAVSGGFDLGHSSGFYIGNWDSSISWISDAVQAAGNTQGTSAPIEMDFYGGYKFNAGPIGVDVGGLEYYYPLSGFKPDPKPDTFELYVAGTWGPATLKYSQAVTNLFGSPNSKNSYYLDLSATFDLGGGFSLMPHVGHQDVKNSNGGTYTDYNIKVAKDLSGWTLTGGVYATSVKSSDPFYNFTTGPAAGKNLGATRVVVSVGKSF
ncbi:MAG TPA: TorF family putative porin [Burkholderiaceae bacterium]|nr:TorF family putative porin [Burkholderiaceae bacterium]